MKKRREKCSVPVGDCVGSVAKCHLGRQERAPRDCHRADAAAAAGRTSLDGRATASGLLTRCRDSSATASRELDSSGTATGLRLDAVARDMAAEEVAGHLLKKKFFFLNKYFCYSPCQMIVFFPRS